MPQVCSNNPHLSSHAIPPNLLHPPIAAPPPFPRATIFPGRKISSHYEVYRRSGRFRPNIQIATPSPRREIPRSSPHLQLQEEEAQIRPATEAKPCCRRVRPLLSRFGKELCDLRGFRGLREQGLPED